MLQESLATLRKARLWILLAASLLLTGCLLGFLFQEHLGFLQRQVAALMRQFSDKTALDFIASIFLHNLLAAYVAMCFVTLFGVLPMAMGLLNGLLLGWFAAQVLSMYGPETLMELLPHGAFEIPAVLIAWGVGIWRGFGFRVSGGSSSIFERWKEAHRVFVSIVLPLLFLAAVIEGRYHILEAVLG